MTGYTINGEPLGALILCAAIGFFWYGYVVGRRPKKEKGEKGYISATSNHILSYNEVRQSRQQPNIPPCPVLGCDGSCRVIEYSCSYVLIGKHHKAHEWITLPTGIVVHCPGYPNDPPNVQLDPSYKCG